MNRRDALKKLAAGGAGAGAAAVAASGDAKAPGSVGFAVFVRSIETKHVPLTAEEAAAERRDNEAAREEYARAGMPTAALMLGDMFEMTGGPPRTKEVRAEPTIPFAPVGATGGYNSEAGRYDPAGPGDLRAELGCVPLREAFLFTSRGAAETFASCVVALDGIEGGYHTAQLHIGDTSQYDDLEWEVREVSAADLASPEAARPVPGARRDSDYDAGLWSQLA